jgi:ligand-binding sensor protein
MKEIELSDVIDIKALQSIQDAFSSATGMAALAVDLNHDVTKLSNPTDFCVKLTRGSKEGYRRCNDCDLQGGKKAGLTHKPAVYYCHAGLMDFASPIMVQGKQVGSLIGGQILPEKPDPEKFRKIAREIGADEDDYLQALSKIKIMPKEQIEAAANLLYIIANTLSEIGYQKVTLSDYLTQLTQSYYELFQKLEEISQVALQVSDHVGSLRDNFQKLSEASDRTYDEVVKTNSIAKYIEDIAMQIQLLSFNASIVAAGAPNTGLDVIARELNMLSAHNADKANGVQTVLNNVSGSMQKMQKHMSQTDLELNTDLTSIKKLQSCIEQISHIASNLNDFCEKLSKSKQSLVIE